MGVALITFNNKRGEVKMYNTTAVEALATYLAEQKEYSKDALILLIETLADDIDTATCDSVLVMNEQGHFD